MITPGVVSSFTVTLILYLLQGVILGLSTSIPLYLTSAGGNWKHQGTYNFVHYPFSIKLIWAPIIDVFYFRRLGRRQTWLLPIQVLIGAGMIAFSYYVEPLVKYLNMVPLTIAMFLIIFLTASQDVCVDGWTLSLFASTNVVWQSTSQTVGQTFGRFIGSSVLLTFESANFTNRYIRTPLSMPHQSEGLFTLAQFVRFWGVVFLIVTVVVAFLFRERPQNASNNEKNLTLIDTYLVILKLFKKRCVRDLTIILLLSPFGYAASYFMTNLALVKNGMSRETWGLLTMPLIIVKVLVPFVFSKTHQPLIWFARLYPIRILLCILIGIYVYFTSKLIAYPYVFYSVLLGLFVINEAIIYLQLTARVGFYAQVSEPRIGGTYMTLVSTVGNIGQSVSSSAVYYVADRLPKKHAYSIEVILGAIFGLIWLACSWRTMHRLQKLPKEAWYSKAEEDHRTSCNMEEISVATVTTVAVPERS